MIRHRRNINRLIQGSLGVLKADAIIAGGKLVNVYSGEIMESVDIAILDGRIVYVGADAAHTRGEQTEIIDARGLHVAPGFIDAHTHIGHYCRPFEHLQSYVPHGTTALVASCDELSTVFGYAGLKFFLDEVERHPVRVYTLVSMVAPQDPLLCDTASLSADEIAAALDDPRVLGMGEIVSWMRVLQRDPELLRDIELARRNGQIVHGHTSGARDQKLCAVAASGISSCHEPIRVEDALERLRLGYWTMLREGSLRQDLESTLTPLLGRGVTLQRLMLVTDSLSPDDAEERGHMDYVVRRAVALGLPPIQAIQVVTLNAATYCGLEQEIGGIGPGRWADVVLLEDLNECRVAAALIGGRVRAKSGQSLVTDSPAPIPDFMLNSLRISRGISAGHFSVPSPRPFVKLRVIELLNPTITAERMISVNAEAGEIRAKPEDDLLKVAVFDRHHGRAAPALGFLKGFGAKLGAVGSTTNLDENTLMIVGSDDDDMARCANVLIESGGGIAIVDRGDVVRKLEFPVGGVFSPRPWREVGTALRAIQTCLRESGSPFDKPLYALAFLTFVTLPALRITARGLVNAKERKVVPLFAEQF